MRLILVRTYLYFIQVVTGILKKGGKSKKISLRILNFGWIPSDNDDGYMKSAKKKRKLNTLSSCPSSCPSCLSVFVSICLSAAASAGKIAKLTVQLVHDPGSVCVCVCVCKRVREREWYRERERERERERREWGNEKENEKKWERERMIANVMK